MREKVVRMRHFRVKSRHLDTLNFRKYLTRCSDLKFEFRMVFFSLLQGRRDPGRHPRYLPQPPAPGRGHHVRAALVGPAADARAVALQAGGGVPGESFGCMK